MKSGPKPMSLHRMAVFAPGRQNDEEIAATFIARHALLRMILDDIRQTGSIPQHHLLLGQRGMGKTALLMRIHVALREQPLNMRFIPLGFPEEQYSVDRLSALFLNGLDALADTLERENASCDIIEQIDESVERLRHDPAADEIVAEEAARTLLGFARKIGRRPVLLMDNLDLVFDRLDSRELHQFRAFLMKAGAPVLIGTSVHPPDEDYKAPFYDHFKPHLLHRLSLDEMREVLRGLAQLMGNEEIPARLDQEQGRLRALHALTGGNSRTTRILFEIFANGFSDGAYNDLEALLDWMTSIYKARFEEFSDQAQVIVSALAAIWEPAVLKNICEATRLKPNQVSPHLDRLRKAGVIEETTIDPPNRVGPIPNRRTPKDRTGYQLAERFFNIWFLMRQATRRDKRNLIHLTRFIECWFAPEEQTSSAEETHLIRAISFVSGNMDKGKRLLEQYRSVLSPEDHDKLRFDEMIFHAAEGNWGHILEGLNELIQNLGERGTFQPQDRNSWLDITAALLHYDHGEKLLLYLSNGVAAQRLRPWFEAVRGYLRGDRKYLRNAPVEVRESAYDIFDRIEIRLNALREFGGTPPAMMPKHKKPSVSGT